MAFFNQSQAISACAPSIVTPAPDSRRRFDGLEEGDPILVQTVSGICEQGVFIRIRDGILTWVRTIGNTAFIALTDIDGITITRI